LKTTKLITHRGLHEGFEIPENSMLAFQKAVEKNYGIELDITISKDNQIVVFHDDTLSRLCNVNGNIEDFDYSFLKNLRLYQTDETIPLFREVLETIKVDTLLFIEIKKHKNIGILENNLSDLLSEFNGKYFVCSFEKNILYWLKKYKPIIKRGLIFESLPKKFEKYNKLIFLYKYFKTKPDFISLEYSLFESDICNFCKKKNIFISIWTVNSSKQYEILNEKIDAVIFERINL
jgi:glycerophosphoryl diester phosphodiesterase